MSHQYYLSLIIIAFLYGAWMGEARKPLAFTAATVIILSVVYTLIWDTL